MQLAVLLELLLAVLVQATLGFVTYSVGGVSDVEMEDLLSLHDEVLDFVFQYSTPNIRRLPSHVWLRLKGALSDLLVEGDGGCLVWYHRQLKETAEAYFSSHKRQLYGIMARYFTNTVAAEVRDSRRITKQELTVCGRSAFDAASVVNKRRCMEAGMHLLSSESDDDLLSAERELCDFGVICSMIRAGYGFQLLRDVIALDQRWSLSLCNNNSSSLSTEQRQSHERVNHYRRWLGESMYYLSSQDCISNFTFSGTAQPYNSIVRADCFSFMANLKCQQQYHPLVWV